MAQYLLREQVFLTVLIAVIISFPLGGSLIVSAASSTDFSQANAAISNAYVSLYNAQIRDHANVTTLVNQLDTASQLVNTALVENSTNPTQATADLLSAESIAQEVSNKVGSASSLGMSAYHSQLYESLGSMIAILIGAILVYKLSGFIHQQWWMRVYRNYRIKVRKRNGE